MKTFKGIRIVTMSMIALVAFGFASRAVAAIDAFIIFKASDGKITKVKIKPDGSFSTSALRAGKYRWSFGATQSAMGAATGGGGTGKISSGAGDRPTESITLNFTKIMVTYDIVSPRDPASGLPSGKRMHKPYIITAEIGKSSPSLSTDLGTVVVDADGDAFSGTVVPKNKADVAVALGDCNAPPN